ncbi:MAG: pirin family protein [Sphingobacterium paramultivorum]
MSNIAIVIEERAADIGNFLVGRLLPFRQKRMVGPFIFIDHMGPDNIAEPHFMDIAPHPHIGLSTLTYLFEGSIMHRDSLGNAVEIKPGAVNWMTAGKGVTHSERTPEQLRSTPHDLHGLQIWVALPKELEKMEPNFVHIEEPQLPHWTEDGVSYRLIAGEIKNHRSEVPVYSPIYLIEIKAEQDATIKLGDHLYGESGLYILHGTVHAEGQEFGPKQILVAKDAKLCEFEMKAGTSVYIFGGEPFPEQRYIDWNFVASDIETLKIAREKWENHEFPKVPGDDGYIPIPPVNPTLGQKKNQ